MYSLVVSTLYFPAVDPRKILMSENLRLYTSSPVVMCKSIKRSPVTNQTVTGSRLTSYIVNVIRSPVIERLMVRCSQVALKHVIHDMVTRTLVMELRRCAIKRWVPCDDMDRRLKISHSAKVECGFWTTPEECLYDSGLIGLQYKVS